MATELRCKSCNYWIGESIAPLIAIAVVRKSTEVATMPPRDLRVCKSCGMVNVLVQLADLDIRRNEPVG